MPLPQSNMRREGLGGPIGTDSGDSVKHIIQETSDQLNHANSTAVENTRAYQAAYEEHIREVVSNRQALDSVLKTASNGSDGAVAKYPALTAGTLLAAILAALKLFDVEINDEDVQDLSTILEFVFLVVAPVVTGYLVHRNVSPVPPQLKGN